MNLYLYFGMVGILSIAAWLGALLTALNYARQPRRLGYFSRALGLALIGWLLAAWNSHNVGLIEIDRTQELKAAYDQQRRIRIEDGGIGYDLSANARFAEDGALDALDLAGIKSDDKQNIYEKAVKKDSWAERRAKRKRALKLGTNEFDAMLKDTVIVEDGRKTVYRPAKKLPASDVIRADRLDKTNRWAALFVFYLCLFLIAWEYVRWFNRTVGFYLPLPIAGRRLDAWSPKRHSTVFLEKDDAWDRRFLEDIVAKGETFIYAGPRDPLPVAAVSRFAVPIRQAGEKIYCRLHLQRALRFLPFWPTAAELWRLPKLVYAPSQAAIHESFLFESAWFGRYAFSMPAAECAVMIPALIDFLKQRLQTRARANRTVHVVLRGDDQISETAVKQLAFLAGETNFKAVWLMPQPQVQRLTNLVEEVCPDQAVPVCRTTYMAVIVRWCRAMVAAISTGIIRLQAARREHRKIRLEKAEMREQAKVEAQARAEVEAKAAAQAKAEAEAKAQAEAEAHAAAQVKTEAEAKAQVEAETKARAEAEAEKETLAKAKAVAKAQVKLKPKAVEKSKPVPIVAPRKAIPFVKAQPVKVPPQTLRPVLSKAQEQPGAEARAEAEAKARVEAEARARAEAEAKAAAQAAAEAEIKARAEAEARAAAQAKAEAEAKARAEAEAKVAAEAEAKARAETEAKAKAEAEAKARAEAEAKAAAQAAAEAESKARADAEAKARIEAEAKAKVEAEAKAAAQAKAKPQAILKPKVASLRPKLANVPVPTPQAQPPAPPPEASKPPEMPAPKEPLDLDSIKMLYSEGIVKFYCRHCKQKLSAPIQLGGTQIKCPACSMPLTIPAVPPQPGT